jgi:hypothetical protein
MLGGDPAHDPQPVSMATTAAEPGPQAGEAKGPHGEREVTAVMNDEAEETSLFSNLQVDLALAVLEAVADHVVQRLTELDSVAVQERVTPSPVKD